MLEEESDEGTDDLGSDEEDEEAAPGVKAYQALMQSLDAGGAEEEDGERKRKRRKIEKERTVVAERPSEDGVETEESESDASLESDAGVEVEADKEDGSSDDDDIGEASKNGYGHGEAIGDEDDDQEDASDPYESHFASTDEKEMDNCIQSIKANEWRTEKQAVPKVGSFTLYAPKSSTGSTIRQPTIKTSDDLGLKKRVADNARKHLPSFDDTQQSIAPYVFNYTDVLYTARTPNNAESLRSLACLHALNHVLKGRDKVIKNNARLAHAEHPETLDLRDQGFTRPKVLILTETRQHVFYYGTCLANLFAPEQQENKQRFHDAFASPIDDTRDMPDDYRELFDGNNDNSFLTAMKFTRKTLKFFSPFYTSDIILASPLGLRRLLENPDKKKRDHDFLSSLDLLILDQTDAMQMQTWTNLTTLLPHLNLQPTTTHDADFTRVRPYHLDDLSAHYRQTLIFTAYLTPEILNLFHTTCLNHAGKLKLTPDHPGTITSPPLPETLTPIKQTFTRFPSPTPQTDPDARFKYFISTVLPSLLRSTTSTSGNSAATGILLFIPSPPDLPRLRNALARTPISFTTISEYTTPPSRARARALFADGRASVLLYTQRAHHFFRLRLKGVKRVIFYGVPAHGGMWTDVVGGMLARSLEDGLGAATGTGGMGNGEGGVKCLFSSWDGLALERVVGTSRVRGMLGARGGSRSGKGGGETFEFY